MPRGIRAIRLDAAGYAVKKPGTSCFMIPETFAFIDEITAQARALGMEVLVEVHGYYQRQIDMRGRSTGSTTSHCRRWCCTRCTRRDATPLKHWIEIRPRNAVTVLDTHDGIGVLDVGADERPARAGLLAPEEIDALVETIHERSRGESRLATGGAASNLDLYQVNCTFYDALGRRDDAYLTARAIQCFVPGMPQIYYVGLLAGGNDLDLLRRTGVGRDINRHYYTAAELRTHLDRPVVQACSHCCDCETRTRPFAGTFPALRQRRTRSC